MHCESRSQILKERLKIAWTLMLGIWAGSFFLRTHVLGTIFRLDSSRRNARFYNAMTTLVVGGRCFSKKVTEVAAAFALSPSVPHFHLGVGSPFPLMVVDYWQGRRVWVPLTETY